MKAFYIALPGAMRRHSTCVARDRVTDELHAIIADIMRGLLRAAISRSSSYGHDAKARW